MLAYPWTGLGLTLLDLERPQGAVEPLELAYQVRGEGKAIPKERGNSAFNLAQALFASGGDRGRARELAFQALAFYSEAGESAKAEREKVEAWMRERGW